METSWSASQSLRFPLLRPGPQAIGGGSTLWKGGGSSKGEDDLLNDLLEGASTPENWEVDATTEGEWSMANQQTGETIRMVMD